MYCPEDGRDVRAHAKAGDCPIGKHPPRTGGEEQPDVAENPKDGPGTELKKLLVSMLIGETAGCGCAAFAAEMDEWGPDECERRADEIVARMLAEAGRRWWGKALLAMAPGAAEAKARELLVKAIRRSRSLSAETPG